MNEDVTAMVRTLVEKLRSQEQEWLERSALLFPLIDRVPLEGLMFLLEVMDLVPGPDGDFCA